MPPGVVCDGVQWNECVPVNMRGREPVQEKTWGVFVWGVSDGVWVRWQNEERYGKYVISKDLGWETVCALVGAGDKKWRDQIQTSWGYGCR